MQRDQCKRCNHLEINLVQSDSGGRVGSDRGGGGRVGAVDTVGGLVSTLLVSGSETAGDSWVLVVVADAETETSRVDVAVTEQEEGTENGLGEQVKDTVEDSLGVRGDKVTTLANTPSDGVEEPEERGQGTAHEEDLADICAEVVGVGASFEDEHVKDVEEGNVAENEVWPLVAGRDDSTDKTGDDHDLVDENGVENRGPWHAGGQEQVHEEKRSGDDPD